MLKNLHINYMFCKNFADLHHQPLFSPLTSAEVEGIGGGGGCKCKRVARHWGWRMAMKVEGRSRVLGNDCEWGRGGRGGRDSGQWWSGLGLGLGKF